ncbi:hypothetical protein HY571_02455 [Candidatus Micrarchaeota archaeon]|nr:hypothetical protein [Candidatus Micrarchaeota archaeon]
MKQLLLALLLLLASSANGITLVEPVQIEVRENVYLGVAGPGQTIELKFSRDTGLQAAINPRGTNALWDQASVVESTLPRGWSYRDSLRYENPLTVFVTINPEAERDNYSFAVGFTDEYEGTAPQTAQFTVEVDPDVLDVRLERQTIFAGVNQPAVFKLIATSKSTASDTFVITAEGLPYDWRFSKTFFLPHNEEKEVFFEVIGNIQKEVPFTIKATSLSSREIASSAEARVITSSNFLQSAKSTTLGLPLFPNVEQHIYSVIGILANYLAG